MAEITLLDPLTWTR